MALALPPAAAELTEPVLRIDGRARFFARGVPASLAVDRDARQIALAAGGEVTLFDGPDARRTTVLLGKSNVMKLAFSPDGRRLLGVSALGHLVVWDTRTKRVRIDDSRKLSEDYIRHASFSADASRLVFSDGMKRVVLVDLTTGERLLDRKLSNGILCLRLSADGRRFAYGQPGGSGIVGRGGRLGIQAVGEGKDKAPRPLDIRLPNSPTLLSFTPDGERLAVFARRFGSYIYDCRTGKEIRALSGTPGKCQGLEVSPDGRTVLLSYPSTDLGLLKPLADPTATDGEGATTRPAGPETIEIDWQGQYPLQVAYSPDGGKFVIANRIGNTICVYDAATGKREPTPRGGHGSGISLLMSAGPGRLLSGDLAGQLCLWRTDDGTLIAKARLPATAVDADLSPDGRRIAIITLGGPAVGDVPAIEAAGDRSAAASRPAAAEWSLRPLVGQRDAQSAIGQKTWLTSAEVAWLDANRIVCTGFRAQRVYNVDTGELLADLLDAIPVRPRSSPPALSPDGRFFAELHRGGSMFVGRTATGEPLTILDGQGRPTRDGRRVILTGEASGLGMVETFTGKTLWRRESLYPRSGLCKHAVRDDERLLALRGPFGPRQKGEPLGSGPYPLRVVDLLDGRVVEELFPGMRYVAEVCFTHAGRVAVGTTDGTVAIYAAPQAPSLTAGLEDLPKLWRQLASADPAEGGRAVFAMAELGAPAVAFLGERLAPADLPQASGIPELIEQLNADKYIQRAAAEKALRELGPEAGSAIRSALAGGDLTAQQQKVLRELLAEKEVDALVTRTATRAARALEVLAKLDTPEARKLLTRLAGGYEGDWLTQEARRLLAPGR